MKLILGRYLDKNKKLIVGVRDTKDEIDRFQSPISFKVFDNNIYIIPHDIPDKLFDRDFTFDLKIKTKIGSKWKTDIIEEEFMNIRTPQKTDFNLIDFLEKKLRGYQTKKSTQ